MWRPELIVGLTALVALTGGAQEVQRTQLRHGHTLVIPAQAGEQIEGRMVAIAASTGYPDPLGYRLLDPGAKHVLHGEIPVGQDEALKFRARTAGAYLLLLDPQRNACALEGVKYALDLGEERLLQIIKTARPVYFRVPTGVKRFTLDCSGEAATVWVMGPTGDVVLEQQIPQYEQRKLRVNVPAGADGKLWSLRTKLAEDLGVRFDPVLPTIVSEWPETLAQVEKLGERAGFVKFDATLTPEKLLKAPPPSGKRLRASAGGVELEFTSEGRIASVAVGGKKLGPGKEAPLTGFFVRDVESGGIAAASGTLEQEGRQFRQTSRLEGLRMTLTARLEVTPGALRGTARLKDLRGKDRAVTLYFGIPVAKADLSWWDDIDTARPVSVGGELGRFNSTPFGATGKNSVYPWACVGNRQAALACGIPMDQPRLNRLVYNAQVEMLYLAWDLALVPETTKFPSAAEVSFVVYAADPAWGFRSAAERYYPLFASCFEKRMQRDGMWVCWSSLEKMENIEQWGTMYHWGVGGPRAAAFDNKHGIFAFLYNDSVRYFADLGTFEHKPTPEETAAVFEQYLSAPDPAAFVLSRPKSATGRQRYVGLQRSMGEEAAAEYLKRAVAAVKASAAHDSQGRMETGYVIDRKDWGPENWWTGRLYCNPLPGIPGGYGRFLLDEIIGRTFAEYEKEGARLDGVGLDNYFVYCQYPDCRREHFAFVSYPLCFLKTNLKPAIVADFALFEWVTALSDWLRERKGYLIANSGRMPYPFAASILDINGFEWNIERMSLIARTLAWHKPVVSLPIKPEHYQEPFIRHHVRFAVLPGGYGGKTQFKAAEIYRKYVPIIRLLAQAGWEPVTWGRSSSEDVKLERFGRGPQWYFTVVNVSDEAQAATVTLNLSGLGAEGKKLTVHEMFSRKELAPKVSDGKAELSVALPPNGALALAVAVK